MLQYEEKSLIAIWWQELLEDWCCFGSLSYPSIEMELVSNQWKDDDEDGFGDSLPKNFVAGFGSCLDRNFAKE